MRCPQAHSCVDDYCGGCNAHFFDSTGMEICKPCPVGPLCAIACEFGYKKDVNGCPICSCQPPPVCSDGSTPVACFQDPCASQTTKCPGAASCVPNYCGGCNALYYDAQGKPFDCAHPPCADMMCSLFCEWGNNVDSNGCPVCSCRSKPVCQNGKKAVACKANPCGAQREVCPSAHSCQVDNCGACTARYFNSTGSEICIGCEPILCEIACMNGFATNPKTGCLECSCRPQCNDLKCALMCPNGFEVDSNGCEICQCRPSTK